MDTIHGHFTKREDVYASMEAAAEKAYTNYHGKRYEQMRNDQFRYLPREDQDGSWVMTDPGNVNTTMEATVIHAHTLKRANDDLQQEVYLVHRAWKRAQEEIDSLRDQLGLPPRFKKLYKDGHWHQ